MDLHIEPITAHNQDTALKLSIAKEQKGFVETVEQCLAEARLCRRWHPVGIYDGNLMVGFAMYGFFLWPYLPWGKLWLDRLLIDQAYQKKGYGKAALDLLLKRLEQEYFRNKIYITLNRNGKVFLSVVRENSSAIALYKKYGFHFNGKLDAHGELIMERPIHFKGTI